MRPHRPLLRPPEPLLGAQVAPSRLAVVGAVVLVLIAALVFGGRVLWARTAAAPHPVAPSGAVAASQSALASARAGSTAASGPAAGFAPSAGGTPSSAGASVLVVQVVGQVRRPGVVQVRAGSRVQDAVQAAGGALPGADLAAINLARPVTDGEQIQVPKPGEQTTPAPAAAPGPGARAPGPAAAGGSAPAVVDLNSADIAALDTLPGVGPVLAQRIVQWRTDNGRFTSVEELGEVSGIGDKLLAQLTPLVRVG
ncbi:ComEA family DNA-binding protein [Flexivirga sp. ID2601S]|uniref:ComEA family DNA-binding protein n=1 Tax=Flexivirga aerilata TaxID=1656889 RepID=A0A849AJ54_9MICO|nr:ComEA family DNA-binding protein [Flexivirga aerilata]